MLELAAELLPLLHAGTPVAVVSVTRVIRSAPRGVGASLAVTSDARVIGSISGGCVENDAVMLGLQAVGNGQAITARFGFGEDGALPAGLACGGAVDVVAYVLSPTDETVLQTLEAARAGAKARIGVVLSGPASGRIIALDGVAGPLAPCILRAAYDGADVLALTRSPPPALIILGAGEHAAALCRVASSAGFAVTVCDAWALLVTPQRFPDAERLVVAHPSEFVGTLDPSTVDKHTAICVLTHDEREDVPALVVALRLPVGFVGAMGARSTVARRNALLRNAGLGDDDLARLHAPLGLDLGGSTPEETALSVLAEIIASRGRGTGLPLRDLHGRIHARAPEPASCSAAEVVATRT